MAPSLRVDPDRLRGQLPELDGLAGAVRAELDRLRTRLTREGACWGADDPGRTFAESYEPAARDGITNFENLVRSLQGVHDGIAETTDAFEDRDQQIGDDIRQTARADGLDPAVPQPPPRPSGGLDPAESESLPRPYRNGSPTPSAEDPNSGDISNFGHVPTTGPEPTSTPFESDPQSPDGASAPPGATAPPMSDGSAAPEPAPAPSASGAPAGPPGSAIAGQPGRVGVTATGAAPDRNPVAPAAYRWGERPVSASANTQGRTSASTPWSRPRVTGPATPGAPRSPWQRKAPISAGPAESWRPGNPPHTPAKPHRDDRRPQRKPVPVLPRTVRTDPAALAAAEELAARHGLRLAGFETSGITEPTVHEIAAALDETLGKFPFLELDGLAIAELSGGVSRVRYEYAEGPGAWIVLDRAAVGDPAGLPARVGTPSRSGDLSRVFAAQPMYATIVADLGRVAAAAAGPRTSRLVQRTLISEYHRLSGPWDRGDTLAAVTRGYRRWRAQLSGACFTGGRLDPRATSAESFTEVELCGAGACGPAKAVHRLVVERARARSDR